MQGCCPQTTAGRSWSQHSNLESSGLWVHTLFASLPPWAEEVSEESGRADVYLFFTLAITAPQADTGEQCSPGGGDFTGRGRRLLARPAALPEVQSGGPGWVRKGPDIHSKEKSCCSEGYEESKRTSVQSMARTVP